jgi:molecular chaperone GrpE
MEEKYMNEGTNMEDLQESLENESANSSETEGQDTEIADLQKQVNELKDKYLRLVADFDNYRKRTARERLDLIQTASKDVITNMLPVLDDSERAEKQIQSAQDVVALKEGISLVFNKLRATLLSTGLKPMETVGKDFNPEFHEAITEIPAPSPAMKGKVLDEVQKGYYLNDKIIRFAKVVVGK